MKIFEEYEDGVPYTGDEIHFTDGAIWSCLLWSSLRPISPEADCVVFIPMSFKNWLDDEFVRDPTGGTRSTSGTTRSPGRRRPGARRGV